MEVKEEQLSVEEQGDLNGNAKDDSEQCDRNGNEDTSDLDNDVDIPAFEEETDIEDSEYVPGKILCRTTLSGDLSSSGV